MSHCGAELNCYSNAERMIAAVRAREISSRELLELHLRRIESIDPSLNTIVARDIERALADASALDSSSEHHELLPLRGLPVTVKESIDLEGMASTAGVPQRVGHRAQRDARTVARLRAAGAVIIGKTNVCPYLADFIADNPVYGRTVNPWDASRTPGGSSGGSASVAAGLCAIDLGSDLGGSVRIPPSFCGIWGHKPSEGLVPNSGHFPGSPLPNAAWTMAGQGPMARSARDLELMLDVIAGPDVGIDAAWHIALPPARHQKLADFRVAVLPSLPWLPVDPEIVAAMDQVQAMLRAAGARVEVAIPPTMGDCRPFYQLMRWMMSALVSAWWPAERRAQVIADRAARQEFSHDADVRGFRATAGDYLQWHAMRENYRQAYRDFFREWDILLTPMSLVPPFEHPTIPVADRIFDIGGQSIGFDYLSFYPGIASLPGHGATALPIGFSAAGLPLGAQAIGPFLEDRTPIRFCQLVEGQVGGFHPPANLAIPVGD